MKHNYSDFAILAELEYVGSMQNLKGAGYRRPGLDDLCEELKIERRGHSTLDDAKILQTVCTMKSEEMLQNPYGYTFIDNIYIIPYHYRGCMAWLTDVHHMQIWNIYCMDMQDQRPP